MKKRALTLISSCLLVTSSAHAYTVRTTDDGAPIKWDMGDVVVVVDPDLRQIGDDASVALSAAFATWSDATDIELPTPSLTVGPVDDIGYRQGEPNWSTVRYVAEGSSLAGKALAITVLTFDSEGHVLDADVIVNGGQERPFGVLPADGPPDASAADAYDLQNVLTHEVGHFLGLGEEEVDAEATMFVTSARGEIKKRDLADDDVTGLSALYLDDEASSAMACAMNAASRTPYGSLGFGVACGALALWSRRRLRTRKGVAFAAFAGALVALPFGVPFDGAPSAERVDRSDVSEDDGVLAHVVRADATWEGGLLTTRLVVESPADGGALHTFDVWGGTLDGITQIVGHAPTPKVGDRIRLRGPEGDAHAGS